MARIKNDYFKLIENQASYCVQASKLLEEIFCGFDAAKVPAQREQMHHIEHTADGVHHDILTRLSVEFITPIDQEDILRLVQIIDDITDALDEVVMDFYMYDVNRLPARSAELARVVHRCVEALYAAATELKNFKKPEKLRELLVKMNDIETEGDAIYIAALHDLFVENPDAKTLIGSRAIYESLEHCCDLCEDAAEIIEQVVIKNT